MCHRRKVLGDLYTDRGVAGHHGHVVECVDENAIHAVDSALHEGVPPCFGAHGHDTRAERLHRGDLRGGCGRGYDDRARHAEPFRKPGRALSHVAGGRGHDAGRHLVRGRTREDGGGAAQLERTDRLQVLKLEVDLRSPD